MRYRSHGDNTAADLRARPSCGERSAHWKPENPNLPVPTGQLQLITHLRVRLTNPAQKPAAASALGCRIRPSRLRALFFCETFSASALHKVSCRSSVTRAGLGPCRARGSLLPLRASVLRRRCSPWQRSFARHVLARRCTRRAKTSATRCARRAATCSRRTRLWRRSSLWRRRAARARCWASTSRRRRRGRLAPGWACRASRASSPWRMRARR